MRLIPVFLIAFSLFTGCSSMPDKEISLKYAKVMQVNRVAKPSAVPAGVIVGGLTGLFLARNSASTGKRAAATVGGAAVGGVLADAMSDDRAYEYILEYRDGERTRFVTEKGHIRKGDCVSIERGKYANLRKVDKKLCDGSTTAMSDARLSDDARQCHDAKEQLLLAQTEDEVNQASRKVKILCQYQG